MNGSAGKNAFNCQSKGVKIESIKSIGPTAPAFCRLVNAVNVALFRKEIPKVSANAERDARRNTGVLSEHTRVDLAATVMARLVFQTL